MKGVSGTNHSRLITLIIMDGWGINKKAEGNAIALAKTPNIDKWTMKYPNAEIKAFGKHVGLPEGQMGNSEVGHLNIGAGRIVYQDYTRINKAIKDKSFFKNEVLLKAVSKAEEKKSALHIMGLLSDGGVHSHIRHLFALFDLIKEKGLREVYFHAFLDGRDTSPTGGIDYIADTEKYLDKIGLGKIATVMGRYYAMDRDQRWDRVQKAYEAMVLGQGRIKSSAKEAVSFGYEHNETDEFLLPTVITDKEKKPITTIKDNDVIIFLNFRADRAREITKSLTEPAFNEFPRKKFPKLSDYVCMAEYDEKFDLPIAFPTKRLNKILGEVISENNLRQLRIAETEKYAHVTLFFNGGEEKPFPFEDRALIPSPKVPTYDLKPEMSAFEVTEEIISRIKSKKYNLIVLNYANPDMVGHTGILSAAVKACETVDECLGRVVSAVTEAGGITLITADHGNAEQMFENSSDGPHTAHTSNLVPFILLSEEFSQAKLRNGILADIAPTILELLGIEKPKEMTGQSLILQ